MRKKTKLINLHNQLLIFFLCFISYEYFIFFKLKKKIRQNLIIYKKYLKLFNNKEITDNEKQKFILKYSKLLFIISIKILLIFIFFLILIYSINFISPNFHNFLFSIMGISEATIIIYIYHLLRKKFL